MKQIQTITAKYFEVLRQALDTGNFHSDQIPFDDQVSVVGPNERFDGIEAVKQMFPFFAQVLKDFKLKDSFFNAESACFIIEYFPVNGGPSILTAEWFQFKNGRIASIAPIYDTSAWANVAPSSST